MESLLFFLAAFFVAAFRKIRWRHCLCYHDGSGKSWQSILWSTAVNLMIDYKTHNLHVGQAGKSCLAACHATDRTDVRSFTKKIMLSSRRLSRPVQSTVNKVNEHWKTEFGAPLDKGVDLLLFPFILCAALAKLSAQLQLEWQCAQPLSIKSSFTVGIKYMKIQYIWSS